MSIDLSSLIVKAGQRVIAKHPSVEMLHRVQNPVTTYITDVIGQYTTVNAIPSLKKFGGVKLHFAKHTSARSFTCFVASAASATDNGSALTWTQVTYNGSATITIPALASATVPEEVVSDFATVLSKTTAEGAHILHIRTVETNPVIPIDYTQGPSIALRSDLIYGTGKGYRWGRVSGSYGNTGAITLGTASWMPFMVQAVSFYGENAGYTLASMGDSLDCGWNHDNGSASNEFQRQSPVLNASLLLRQDGYDVHPNAVAVAGSTTDQQIARLSNIVLLNKPTFCTVRLMTPNDGLGCDIRIPVAKKMAFISDLIKNGITPILLTIPPYSSVTYRPVYDPQRVAVNSFIKSMSDIYIVADIDEAIRDTTDPQIINPIYSIGTDTIHCNAAGYAKCGETIANAIKQSLYKLP